MASGHSPQNCSARGMPWLYVNVREWESPRFIQWPGPPKLRKGLAEAYLAPTGTGDTVQCPVCDLTLSNWGPTDHPWERHSLGSPTCVIVKEGQPPNTASSDPPQPDYPRPSGACSLINNARRCAVEYVYTEEETDRAIHNLWRNRGEHQTQMY